MVHVILPVRVELILFVEQSMCQEQHTTHPKETWIGASSKGSSSDRDGSPISLRSICFILQLNRWEN